MGASDINMDQQHILLCNLEELLHYLSQFKLSKIQSKIINMSYRALQSAQDMTSSILIYCLVDKMPCCFKFGKSQHPSVLTPCLMWRISWQHQDGCLGFLSVPHVSSVFISRHMLCYLFASGKVKPSVRWGPDQSQQSTLALSGAD